MPLASRVTISLFVEKLTQELGKFGATLLLSSERLDEIYGVAGASQYRVEDGGHAPLVNWLTEQETRHAKILYLMDRRLAVDGAVSPPSGSNPPCCL